MAIQVRQEGILVDVQVDPELLVYQEGILVDAKPLVDVEVSQAGVSVSWLPGYPREVDVSHAGVSSLWEQQEQNVRVSHGGVSPLWEMEEQSLRVSHGGVSVLWRTGGYLMLRFSTLGHDDVAAALNVPGVTFDANGNLNVNLNLYVDGNLLQMLQLMLKSTYDTNDNGQVDKADDADKLGGVAAADYLTEVEHTAIGNGAPHHAAVTLDADAAAIFDVTGQEIGLDTQAVGTVLAGPFSGADDEPSMKQVAEVLVGGGLGEHLFTAADGLLLLGPHTKRISTAWVGSRGEIATLTGAFHEAPGAWANSKALVVEREATNLIKNPSIEIDTAPFAKIGTGTDLTRITTDKVFGVACLQVAAADVAGAGVSYGISDRMAVTEGTVYTLSLYIRLTSETTRVVQLQIPWFDALSGGSLISTDTSNLTLTNSWTKFVFTATAPVGALGSRFSILRTTTGAHTYLVDGVNFVAAAYATTHVDGDQGTGYTWSSTPHASTSTRAATVVSLDAHVEMLNGRDTVTHAIWMQAPYDADSDAWPTDPNIMDCYGDASNRYLIAYRTDTDRLVLHINGTTIINAAGQTFKAGDWLHVVTTSHFSSKLHRLYLNGVLVGTSTPALTAPTGLTAWKLGANYGGASGIGGWTFGEYAVLGTVWSAEEVAADYAQGRPLADAGALRPPVDNLGPLAASWPITSASGGTSSDIYVEHLAFEARSRFGWGAWVSGKLQVEAVLAIEDATSTGYAMLLWKDGGMWREIPESEVSITGTTSPTLVRSAVFELSPVEREYLIAIKTSNVLHKCTLFKAVLICTPGGLSEI